METVGIIIFTILGLALLCCLVMTITINVSDYFDKHANLYEILLMWSSQEHQNIILTKYFNYLEKLRNDENVFIRYYDNADSLNANRSGCSKNSERAAATYSYLISLLHDEDLQLPRINLVKEDDIENVVWLYAHELGHHFAICYDKDYTEERANQYRKIFAEQCLSYEELVKIGISIECYSHEKFDFDLNEEKYRLARLESEKIYREKWNNRLFGIPAKLFKNYKN
jgi:hypothetical protein